MFSELLSVAYADGASLLKWGGDAALLLFVGDGHLPRACRAAFDMQGALRRTGRVRTSVGQVRLQMSVGVHSGCVHLFLLGDVHRELLVAGPGHLADRPGRVGRRRRRGAPERRDSAPSRSALPRHASLGGCTAASRTGRAAPAAAPVDVAGVDLMGCIPVALRERLLSGARDPEHRPVTVAFIEASDTDRVLADDGPEALATALHDLVSAVQHAALHQQVSCPRIRHHGERPEAPPRRRCAGLHRYGRGPRPARGPRRDRA